MRRLEAMLLVGDAERVLVVSGSGDVIEPDDGIAAIGSGGGYALAAARATRPPIDEDQKNENQHDAPQDELEVAEIIAKPFQSHERPPKDRIRTAKSTGASMWTQGRNKGVAAPCCFYLSMLRFEMGDQRRGTRDPD